MKLGFTRDDASGGAEAGSGEVGVGWPHR